MRLPPQSLKPLVSTLKIVPLPESVSVPMFSSVLDPEGNVVPTEAMQKAAATMLAELARWSGALKVLRQP